METIAWLACAFAAVWIGLGAYLAALALRLNRLGQRIRGLEALEKE